MQHRPLLGFAFLRLAFARFTFSNSNMFRVDREERELRCSYGGGSGVGAGDGVGGLKFMLVEKPVYLPDYRGK